MPAQQMYDLMSYMKQNGITFCYCGLMTENILVSMGDAIKKSLAADDADRKTTKTVFSIFVEQVQNVIRYSAQRGSINGETDVRYGVLTMGKEDQKIFLGCGNMIENKDVAKLKDNLASIQKLDRKQLKALYKETLRGGAPEGSKGAGVGFIEIALRATHGFDFDFIELDTDHSFFTLTTYI